ncbi:hypothetical protein ABW21_db0206194 [Orbilia brochopaga]|nr:hypothetical protein ABW21_db0206194 [Drechslerella brochopaga]
MILIPVILSVAALAAATDTTAPQTPKSRIISRSTLVTRNWEPDVLPYCDGWIIGYEDDDCNSLAIAADISVADLLLYNPALARECKDVKYHWSYCIHAGALPWRDRTSRLRRPKLSDSANEIQVQEDSVTRLDAVLSTTLVRRAAVPTMTTVDTWPVVTSTSSVESSTLWIRNATPTTS